MSIWTNIFILGLVLTDFRLLATSRLATVIQTTVFQAFALSAFMLTMADRPWPPLLIFLALLTLMVKGLVLPWLLRRAMRETRAQREIEPIVGYSASVLVGIVLLGLSFLIFIPLKTSVSQESAFLLPAALFTTLTGLMIIISRKNALTQVVGYLVMENGVYAFGAALAVEEPLLVEMGVLLDVFVAVFVMGITVYQISREFDNIDTDRLSELKD
ncbi:MAG: hydrogenase [Desulfobacterium sp.]|nr:hydrogenase [Desulfobacterium sp.]MBU3947648.1 hydrogenase [Pseudomonadota bacterium]MBU4036611.1 hydrogenase [Pseudomonadota bacterium]